MLSQSETKIYGSVADQTGVFHYAGRHEALMHDYVTVPGIYIYIYPLCVCVCVCGTVLAGPTVYVCVCMTPYSEGLAVVLLFVLDVGEAN